MIEQTSKEQSSLSVVGIISSSSHPKVAFFHLLFKSLPLFLYLTSSVFAKHYTSWFIPCVLFLAADFWTTKNVSGRLMVGLRWWSETDEEGNNIWRFENRSMKDRSSESERFVPTGSNISDVDYRIFWYSMYFNGLMWLFFLIWNVLGLKLSNLLIIAIALSLQWSNIVGYWKCHKDMESKLESNLNSFIKNNAFSYLRQGIFGSNTSSNSG